MLKFLNVCDKFRKIEGNESIWHEMMNTRKEIKEKTFLKLCDISIILDEEETWEEYKNNTAMQGDPIKYYKSANGLYFFSNCWI